MRPGDAETMAHAYVKDIMTVRREVTQDVIVTLAGDLGSVILGRNIVDQVRHLEGVVAVRDRFSYPLPART